MPGKTFRNQTDQYVWVSLTVREGQDPWAGPPHAIDGNFIDPQQDKFVGYGDDSNPFVDSIWASVDEHFQTGVTKIDSEHTRGGPNDSAMNTNDTVTVSVGENGALALAFSNG